MAEVSGAHTDIPPELRRLAQAILNGIDPAVRIAAAKAAGAGTGKCQQVWCPVCALAAVVNGEQHPLATVIANHSVALLDVVRAIVDDIEAAPVSADESSEGDETSDETTESPVSRGNGGHLNGSGAARNGYQAIPVTLQD